jgi:hypothetical protein
MNNDLSTSIALDDDTLDDLFINEVDDDEVYLQTISYRLFVLLVIITCIV